MKCKRHKFGHERLFVTIFKPLFKKIFQPTFIVPSTYLFIINAQVNNLFCNFPIVYLSSICMYSNPQKS